MFFPTISVIIPVRPGGSAEAVLRSLTAVDYTQDRIEILVVEGEQPSAQRNAAARIASGDILYFLDDDSEADIDLFHFAARSFRDPSVAVVGGPSEIIPRGNLLQRCIGYVLGSYFATANGRCRFRAIGRREQQAKEHSLILCNLAVRRDVFNRENGLDERLYPNEENEFLNRLSRKGYRAIYNPKMVVSRPHRSSLGQFVKQMFTYGRGRMDHFLLRPRFFNPLYLLPLAFVLYILSLPIVICLAGHTWRLFLYLYLLPLMVYVEGVAVTMLRVLAEERDWLSVFLVPLLFPLVHTCYGLGLVWGLVRRVIPFVSLSSVLAVGDEAKPRVWLVKPLGTSSFSEGRSAQTTMVAGYTDRLDEPKVGTVRR